jgi:hypothetical protein
LRFFSLLDISGSLTTGGGPLLDGNYWLEDDPVDECGDRSKSVIPNWPAYDPDGVGYSILTVFQTKIDPQADNDESLPHLNDLHGPTFPPLIRVDYRRSKP